MTEFEPFPKIARLSRECVVTEKVDGTNAQVFIGDDGSVTAGSRGRYITPAADNHGFAAWVERHKDELAALLGPGRHFGEWWGRGIQRGYNQIEKRFSLFDVRRWAGVELPECVGVVPVLYEGLFDTARIEEVLCYLRDNGSVIAPGYPFPEGIIVYHKAAGALFKKTIERDDEPKGRH